MDGDVRKRSRIVRAPHSRQGERRLADKGTTKVEAGFFGRLDHDSANFANASA